MSIETAIVADLKWVRSHVITVFLFAALAFGVVYGVEVLLSRHDSANNQKWQALLTIQQQQTQLLQSQLQLDEQRWSAANTQLLAANQKLAAAVSSRDAALAARLKQDANLTAAETAKRLGGTASGDDIVLPLPVGRTITISLDTLSAVQADLADTKSQLANEVTVAANLQENLDSQDKLLSAFRTQSDVEVKACQAQVKDLKSSARKGKLKAFAIGWVAGLLSARLLGI